MKSILIVVHYIVYKAYLFLTASIILLYTILYIHTYIHTYIYTILYIYVYIYYTIHIYIHTYTLYYTYMHTYILLYTIYNIWRNELKEYATYETVSYKLHFNAFL